MAQFDFAKKLESDELQIESTDRAVNGNVSSLYVSWRL